MCQRQADSSEKRKHAGCVRDVPCGNMRVCDTVLRLRMCAMLQARTSRAELCDLPGHENAGDDDDDAKTKHCTRVEYAALETLARDYAKHKQQTAKCNTMWQHVSLSRARVQSAVVGCVCVCV